MQHRLKGAARRFLAQNAYHVAISVARVDDERQARLARRGDVGAEDALLHVTWAAVVVIVEAGLADPDAARMHRQGGDLSSGNVRLLGRMVGMRADREEDAIVALGERAVGVEARDMRRDCDQARDADRVGPRQDRVRLAGELAMIKMAMAVD